MIYTVEEIKERIIGLTSKFEVGNVFLFGSYARGEATEQSDIDLAVTFLGSEDDLYKIWDFQCELSEVFLKKVSVLLVEDIGELLYEGDTLHCKMFKENFEREKVMLV